MGRTIDIFQGATAANLEAEILPVGKKRSKDKGGRSSLVRELSRNTLVQNVESEAIWRAQAAAQQKEGLKQAWRCFSAQSFQGRAKEIAYSQWLGNFILVLIMINLILLGVEVDMGTTRGQHDIPKWFNIFNFVIVCIFTLEILLKLVALGLREFLCGPDRWWNVFDLLIILASLTESALELWARASLAAQMVHIRSLRFIRVVRALRGFRVIRFLRYVSALRGLIFSIVSTMGSLMWTMVLLVGA